MKIKRLLSYSLVPIAIASCSPKAKPADTAIEAIKDMQKIAAAEAAELAEEKVKEKAAELALNGPIRAGEFRLTISPDASAQAMYAVPVHVLTMTESQADLYRSMSAKKYWESPNSNAKKVTFGKSGSNSAASMSVPFSSGHSHLVVIAKLPGQDQDTIFVTKLKREPSSDPQNPRKNPIRLRVSKSAILPN